MSFLRNRRRLPRIVPSAAFVVTLLASTMRSTTALAGGDEAAAEALFIEAKKLAAEGKFAEACPKFAESNRLDRGAGTLIHLADCYEKNHQTASAWATFRDAASAAQALGRSDWQKLATTRAGSLEPKLAKLTIKVQEPADKIEVTRDGSAMSEASWSTAIPIDVGMHTVAASAPGRKPFKAQVIVTNDGDRTEVIVTRLEVLAAISQGATSPSNPTTPAGADARGHKDDGSGQRTVGYVIGGVGVAGLAVGAITGLIAIGKNSDSKSECPSDGACRSPAAVDANKSAGTFGTISTIGFIAGGVGIAAGAILIFTAPSSSPRTGCSSTKRTASGPRVVPVTDGRSGLVSISGAF